jgi:hypothetical protein
MEGCDRGGGLRQVMEDERPEHAAASAALGGFLMGLGVAGIILARGIEELGFAREGDPGSRAFPVALSLLLVIAGVWELVRWFGERRDGASPLFDFVAWKRPGTRNVIGLGASLVVYVWLLGPLGFASATLLFCAPWMRRFGSGWVGAAAMTIALVVGVEVLFAGVFQVRLPEGSTLLAIDRFMVNL